MVLNIESAYNLVDNILNLKMQESEHTNDVPTPMTCVDEMLSAIPPKAWKSANRILDPCCGHGNFLLGAYKQIMLHNSSKSHQEVMRKLYFQDINQDRLETLQHVFKSSNLHVKNIDFLLDGIEKEDGYDIILANPPYAGPSKNRGLSNKFIEKAFTILNPGGYMAILAPNSWMSCSNVNSSLVKTLLRHRMVHINIHLSKKFFPKVGVMFTWFVLQKVLCKPSSKTVVEGIWNNQNYKSDVYFFNSICAHEGFVPLFCTQTCLDWLKCVLVNERSNIMTSNDLHYHNHKEDFSITQTLRFKYKIIHTPRQIVYSNRPHKHQYMYNVFLPLTATYDPFIDRCGMTQGIAYIPCKTKKEAKRMLEKVSSSAFRLIVSICRWGNFNSVYIMRKIKI